MDLDILDLNDMSWLTQESSVESQKANFDITGGGCDDNRFRGLFDDDSGHIVSLEEDSGVGSAIGSGKFIYNGVYAEDISSDEEIDAM